MPGVILAHLTNCCYSALHARLSLNWTAFYRGPLQPSAKRCGNWKKKWRLILPVAWNLSRSLMKARERRPHMAFTGSNHAGNCVFLIAQDTCPECLKPQHYYSGRKPEHLGWVFHPAAVEPLTAARRADINHCLSHCKKDFTCWHMHSNLVIEA